MYETLDTWIKQANTLPQATFSGSGSLISGQGRGPECKLSLFTASTGACERTQNKSSSCLAPLMTQTPESWGAFVAMLISQVQRRLRYVSVLSSLLSFCILSGKTKISMERIQMGDQERNLEQLCLNSNLLITTLRGKHWPAPVVGHFSRSC